MIDPRFEITAPDDADGYPPFVVNGVGTNTVIAEGADELQYWLREADEHDIPVTWKPVLTDEDDDARIIWEYDDRLGEPYLEPMRAMIHREETETP